MCNLVLGGEFYLDSNFLARNCGGGCIISQTHQPSQVAVSLRCIAPSFTVTSEAKSGPRNASKSPIYSYFLGGKITAPQLPRKEPNHPAIHQLFFFLQEAFVYAPINASYFSSIFAHNLIFLTDHYGPVCTHTIDEIRRQ